MVNAGRNSINISIRKEVDILNKAYYWYRFHPYFDEFYSGKILNIISSKNALSKYFSELSKMKLIEKYFPKGLNPHGLSTLLEWNINASPAIDSITEIIFELVRQLHFPEAPSRLSCLYGSESITQAEQWLEVFENSSKVAPQSLWEIGFESKAKLYDARFLNIVVSKEFSYLTALDNAYKYWNREFTRITHPLSRGSHMHD